MIRDISYFCEKKNKYDIVDKRVSDIEVGEITNCKQSGRYRGVSVGRDKDGYFVCTHRARSKSYDLLGMIPEKDITFIKSTG